MKRIIIQYLLFIFVVALPFVAGAQVIQITGKANPEVSTERLKRIDTLVQDYLDKGWIKGIVTLVVKDNQVVQYKGYGYADAETKKPMEKDAIFRIMSQTKGITSVGMMILYEHGKFLLDEPIADFIPEFRHPAVIDKFNAADTTYTTVPAKREITFRDLLTHSSGIDYTDIGTKAGSAIYAKAHIPSGLGYFDANLLDKMKILAKQPLMFQPGEKWQYGLNSDLLGCLIEVISGMSLDDFFAKNIFQPLGMKDTYFNVPASKAGRMATVYTEDSLQHVIKWNHTFRHIDPDYPLMKKHYFSGGAGLSGTAFDYAIFMQMLLNGGIYNGHRILSPRTIQMMTSSQLDFPFNGIDNFGLGFGIASAKSAARTARTEGTFSWGGYYGTSYFADPNKHMVCLIMTQQSPNSHGDIIPKIEAIIYSSLLK
ncbi:serine hydrolase domain-containing protein [Mucilaginibacter gotjawali]|uniref:Esterase EstB n=2 Tax=Mucilaginibacter gotjawali TaxID=1550579 RepID=A0A110B447_9SPHI|nr:serine hydrolase domain-containing protein [Mucilaginibacter gotjawali]MBB3058544.1 CubicO group peptidase (beta-lactamase class C family) [Mucilaginibacter gotjawali]BAU55768.1 Esterase EstB [Mucilaginibacter gotjawali]